MQQPVRILLAVCALALLLGGASAIHRFRRDPPSEQKGKKQQSPAVQPPKQEDEKPKNEQPQPPQSPQPPAECDPAQTPNLKSHDRATKVAAFKACVAKLTHPTAVALKQYAEGDKPAFDGKWLYTWGDDIKFGSWKDKTAPANPYKNGLDVQDAFVQGKETCAAFDKIRGMCVDAPAAFLDQSAMAAIDAIQRKGFTLQEYVDEFKAKLEAQKLTLGPGYGSNPNIMKLACTYILAANMEIYPTLYETVLAHMQKKPLPLALKPSKFTESYWNTFKVGFNICYKQAPGARSMPVNFQSTGGRGVYFSINRADTAGDHGGNCIRCQAPASLVVIDYRENRNDVTKNDHLFAQAAGIAAPNYSAAAPLIPSIFGISRKQMYGAPAEAEEALKGKAVLYKSGLQGFEAIPYVADKGAIDSSKCEVCPPDVVAAALQEKQARTQAKPQQPKQEQPKQEQPKQEQPKAEQPKAQ